MSSASNRLFVRALLLVALVALAAGCFGRSGRGRGGGGGGGGTDTGVDPMQDGSVLPGDGGGPIDSGWTPEDGGVWEEDAGEIPFDAGWDGGWDAGWDAGWDGGWDAGWDAGRDSGVVDAGRDSGVVDSGPTGAGESCATAEALSSSGGSRSFVLASAVPNHTPFGCGTSSMTPDRAYRWTPTFSGTATITLGDATGSFDTMLAVFSSPTCDGSVELYCDDDGGPGTYDSMITMSVTGGTTYYIVAATYSSAPTSETVTLTVTGP